MLKTSNPNFRTHVKQLFNELSPSLQALDKEQLIILHGYNCSDGIGDFKNLIDYYHWTKELFAPFSQIKIKAIAFVTESKLAISKKVMPKHILNHNKIIYHDINNNDNQYQKSIYLNDIFIITGHPNITYNAIGNPYVKSENLLKPLFQSAKILLNIAYQLFTCGGSIIDSQNNQIFHPQCLLYSRLEYHSEFTYDHTSLNYLGRNHLMRQDCMGIRKNDKGIKFNEELESLIEKSKTIKGKISLLKQVSNHSLLKALLELKTEKEISNEAIRNYLTKTKLGFGYLQGALDAEIFSRLILESHQDERQIDILINIKTFDFESFCEVHANNLSSCSNFRCSIKRQWYNKDIN